MQNLTVNPSQTPMAATWSLEITSRARMIIIILNLLKTPRR